MKKLWMIAMIGVLAAAYAPAASAQFTPNPTYDHYTNQILTDLNNNNRMTEYMLNRSLSRRAGGKGGRNAAASGRTMPSATTFRPVANSIVPQQLAASASTPHERQRRQATFEQSLQRYETNRKQRGQPLNDVADALSNFIALSYNTHVGSSVVKEEQVWAMRDQLRTVLSLDAKFRAMTNREKQQMYEMAAVMGRFVSDGFDAAEAASNKQVMQQFQQMARQNLEQMLGTSVQNVRITDKGLELR